MKRKITQKDSNIEPTDPELMLQVVDGDEKAFEALVQRHEDTVFRLATRILNGNVEEARDVAQDVFIQIWENPRAWKPNALFTTWLYRVTMNRSLNRRRMLKLKSFFSISDIKDEDAILTSKNDTPDKQLEEGENQLQLEREFNRLPARQRVALHLRYREELPVNDVAEAMGVSVKSAESLIFRGKRTLRGNIFL
ncbi:MAG: sigma-70 family RNA polymerase sigma factor [Candidatus Hatepunaea meridiana]|nr:sigma-70 family RNA polymerase sigma factor [Candidatus Hatepunaea meridiana]